MPITKERARGAVDEELHECKFTVPFATSLLEMVNRMPESHLELLSPTDTSEFIVQFLIALSRLTGGSGVAGGVGADTAAGSSVPAGSDFSKPRYLFKLRQRPCPMEPAPVVEFEQQLKALQLDEVHGKGYGHNKAANMSLDD